MFADIQKQLENGSGLKLKLKINNNHSTMLSVKWEPDFARVSLHQMFLEAPQNIMDSLSCYLKKKESELSPSVKKFISEKLKTYDYSNEVNPIKLETSGNLYDLKKIYTALNAEYFDNQLNLKITWFGKSSERPKSLVTLGFYHDSLRLIKINRLLDNENIPDYVISYVIYHEMLHHTCPSFYDKNGQQHIHTKEFKSQEKLFRYYRAAQKWIEEYKTQFFSNN